VLQSVGRLVDRSVGRSVCRSVGRQRHVQRGGVTSANAPGVTVRSGANIIPQLPFCVNFRTNNSRWTTHLRQYASYKPHRKKSSFRSYGWNRTGWPSGNIRLVIGSCSIRISAGTPANVCEVFRRFPLCLQANVGQYLNYVTTASCQILSNSSFIYHHTTLRSIT
jgi:hypothetical protein